MKTDLLLGGAQGSWALSRATPSEARVVCAPGSALEAEAGARGFEVWARDPHEPGFVPARACLSVHYPQILRASLLHGYSRAYNLHPGYLPWGRGYYPVFWALWENTPAGATLHEMAERVDEGALVAQVRVAATAEDTGGSLHARVMAAEQQLFEEFWPRIVRGEPVPARAQAGSGSRHLKSEFEALRRPEAWAALAPEELKRLVRCLTFPGHPNLQFQQGGRMREWALAADGSLEARKLL